MIYGEGYSTISNCINKASVYGEQCAGGILGHDASIHDVFNSINYGDIEGEYAGGIVGRAVYGPTDCSNYGNVNGTPSGPICGGWYDIEMPGEPE